MTFYIYLSVHIFLCLALVGLVLLQQGRGADLGAAFSGASNTLFGASGADKLVVRMTTILAILFMISTILLVNAFAAKPQTAPVVQTTGGGIVGELEREQAQAASAAAAVSVVTPGATDSSAVPVSPENVVPVK